MTSDTFFIEQVYKASALKNTSMFFLVDFFEDGTAKEILISEGLKSDEADRIVGWIGGIPWMIESIILNREHVEEILENLYLQSKSRLYSYMDEKIEKEEDVKVLKFSRKC